LSKELDVAVFEANAIRQACRAISATHETQLQPGFHILALECVMKDVRTIFLIFPACKRIIFRVQNKEAARRAVPEDYFE
jgi:hypothetical protein